jgi:hypothetical protein
LFPFVVGVSRLLQEPLSSQEDTMNPVIAQAIAAEKIRDLRADAAAERLARIAVRSRAGARTSRGQHPVPGLRGRLARGRASLTSAS